MNRVVGEFKRRGDYIQVFRTLYFSDTIIISQEPVGWGSWAFADINAIAGVAWAAQETGLAKHFEREGVE